MLLLSEESFSTIVAKTALESPTFAQYKIFSVTNNVIAVLPIYLSNILSFLIFSSTFLSVS